VVVMEDRALVERRGLVELSGGRGNFEVIGIAPVAVDRSLKVEVVGSGVLHQARLDRRWRAKGAQALPAEASELRKRVQALEDRAAELEFELRRIGVQKNALQRARERLLSSIAEQTGYGETNSETWKRELENIGAQQRVTDDAQVAISATKDFNQRELGACQNALNLAEVPDPELECVLTLALEGSGSVAVRVTYLVPCAVWRPAYRASLTGDRVHVEMEAFVWQSTGEAWNDVTLEFSTARPTLGTAPPRLLDDWLSTRPKTADEKQRIEVTVREEQIQHTGEGGALGREFPGLDDGGEARLIRATGRFSVSDDGQPHRVPLIAFDADAAVELVCPAELAPAASSIARFTNTSDAVLLAGPVDLIRSAGLVGRGRLAFAAPGETLKLSFGSDDSIRVIREVAEKTDESRLTGRKTTRRTIVLYVSNMSPQSHRLVLEERVYVSELKELDVTIVHKECEPAPSPLSQEGIARIEVVLSPHATRTIRFVWEFSAGSKVSGLST
jgi:uncharacterized protein (TIGR02231 family)